MYLGHIVLLIALGSIFSYLVSKVSKKLGAWITVLVSMTSLVLMFVYKGSLNASSVSPLLEFEITHLGWFFSVIMLIVYGTVSFFNIYWMDKLNHPAAYNFLYLLSLAGTIGLFFSKTFVLLFICLEVVVWSSMFIIPLGKSRKASIVYYALSAFGSFSMLFAILLLYSKFNSFEIKYVLSQVATNPMYATITFVLISLAGLVKLGIFPFHIWLPLAHGNAPDTFSPILSGGLVKVGGFIAFLAITVMPSLEAFSTSVHVIGLPIHNYILLILGGISIVVGTLMAIKQEDFKKLIAFSSVANGGYMLIGLGLADTLGIAGSFMHIFAHALASAAAFLSIAAVSYRTGTTKMSELGGLIHRMPVTFLVYLIAIISMAGIPPMSGFISKWLLYQALAKKGMVFIAFAAFFGSIGSFLYVFKPLSGVFLGQLSKKHEDVKEAPVLMIIPMTILSLLTLFYGILPGSVLNLIGKIQTSVGISPIQMEGTKIMGMNGNLDPTVISVVFGFGFVIALVIFLVLPKSRRVDLMDTYTAGEFIYTPDLYHYSYKFYEPFVRLYKNHPSTLRLYEALVLRVKELGQFVNYLFFSYKPGVTVMWITVVTLVVLWGVKL